MFLALNERELGKLQRLSEDKELVEALKKITLNACLNTDNAMRIEVIAAQRIAIDLVDQLFRELGKVVQQQQRLQETKENII